MKISTSKTTDTTISVVDAAKLHENSDCVIAMTVGGKTIFVLEKKTENGFEQVSFKKLLGDFTLAQRCNLDFCDAKTMRIKCLTEAIQSDFEPRLFKTQNEFFQWCDERVKQKQF